MVEITEQEPADDRRAAHLSIVANSGASLRETIGSALAGISDWQAGRNPHQQIINLNFNEEGSTVNIRTVNNNDGVMSEELGREILQEVRETQQALSQGQTQVFQLSRQVEEIRREQNQKFAELSQQVERISSQLGELRREQNESFKTKTGSLLRDSLQNIEIGQQALLQAQDNLSQGQATLETGQQALSEGQASLSRQALKIKENTETLARTWLIKKTAFHALGDENLAPSHPFDQQLALLPADEPVYSQRQMSQAITRAAQGEAIVVMSGATFVESGATLVHSCEEVKVNNGTLNNGQDSTTNSDNGQPTTNTNDYACVAESLKEIRSKLDSLSDRLGNIENGQRDLKQGQDTRQDQVQESSKSTNAAASAKTKTEKMPSPTKIEVVQHPVTGERVIGPTAAVGLRVTPGITNKGRDCRQCIQSIQQGNGRCHQHQHQA